MPVSAPGSDREAGAFLRHGGRLAAARGAHLISKDKAVLCMRKRLATLGVAVHRAWPAEPPLAGA